MSGSQGPRTYTRRDCAVFRKTDEAFGGLSNMAPGFPVRVNGVRVMTIEALYQASRFPHLPEVQRLIIDQHSPMTAKMVSKPHRKDSRADWDKVRITVMRWCLRLKLSQHWSKFSQLLLSTGHRAIVEDSKKDDFWGAIPSDGGTLVGLNVLGRLLMELREEIRKGAELRRVEAPAIENFILFGEPLQVVDFRTDKNAPTGETKYAADDSLDGLALPLFSAHASSGKTLKTRSEPAMPAKSDDGLIEGVKPYAEYKESEQKWLGRIPAHWSLLPNRALFEEVKDRNHPSEEMLSVTITRGIIQQKALLTDTSKKDSSNVNKGAYKLVQPGDIAYNKMRAWQGAVGASSFRGIISPAYIVMRPRKDCTPWYYHHLYRTPSFAKEAERWSYGITSDMWSLRPEHFKVIYSVMPPPDEQAAIVWFLEHANRKIDGFIRAKRKLIALLNEQKQAIIHRAVTRGLNPNVPLKPSGIPWLGDIPKHWEVRRLRTLVYRIEQGVSPQATGFLAEGDSWGVLKSGCVNHGVFRELEHKQLSKGFKVDPAIVVKVGDVLISRACGSPNLVGSVGKVHSLHYRLILSDKTFRAVFRPLVNLDFMVLAMNSSYYRQQVEQAISGAEGMANNLPLSELRSFVFAIPPFDEATAIACTIENELSPLNFAIVRTEREIALMQEYRTRLTADVVTGQLDVRAAAAALPSVADVVATTESIHDDSLEREEDNA